jgi:hypothetical protein
MNVYNAMAVGEKVIQKGGLPLIPHLSHFWHEKFPKPIAWWYAYDNELLKKCDYLVRLFGPSKGADAEVALALELGIKVFTSSEVWHEDFIFPSKDAFQSNNELARRGTHNIQMGLEFG